MRCILMSLLFICCCTVFLVAVPAQVEAAANQPANISVFLQAPDPPLQMGDLPVFKGEVTNQGANVLKSLVVYLSLVSLQPGQEHPVDLEDWSAQKAIRIDQLAPGQTMTQEWRMRLIKSGSFGAALTIVNPASDQPQISPLALFDITPKATVLAGRILPVAVGIPLLLAGLFFLIWRSRR